MVEPTMVQIPLDTALALVSGDDEAPSTLDAWRVMDVAIAQAHAKVKWDRFYSLAQQLVDYHVHGKGGPPDPCLQCGTLEENITHLLIWAAETQESR